MTNYKSLYSFYQTTTYLGLIVVMIMMMLMHLLLDEHKSVVEELRYYKIHSTLNTTMPIAPTKTEDF